MKVTLIKAIRKVHFDEWESIVYQELPTNDFLSSDEVVLYVSRTIRGDYSPRMQNPSFAIALGQECINRNLSNVIATRGCRMKQWGLGREIVDQSEAFPLIPYSILVL